MRDQVIRIHFGALGKTTTNAASAAPAPKKPAKDAPSSTISPAKTA